MYFVRVSIIRPEAITEDLESRHMAHVKGTYESSDDFLHIGSLMGEAGGGVYIFKWEDKQRIEDIIGGCTTNCVNGHRPILPTGGNDGQIIRKTRISTQGTD